MPLKDSSSTPNPRAPLDAWKGCDAPRSTTLGARRGAADAGVVRGVPGAAARTALVRSDNIEQADAPDTKLSEDAGLCVPPTLCQGWTRPSTLVSESPHRHFCSE